MKSLITIIQKHNALRNYSTDLGSGVMNLGKHFENFKTTRMTCVVVSHAKDEVKNHDNELNELLTRNITANGNTDTTIHTPWVYTMTSGVFFVF